jgi:SNF2 family DNA or RNA helicase
MSLYPFQEAGVEFLSDHYRAYLADEMGLGKTVQAIIAAEYVLWDDSQVLVVCPASVVENWRREWDEWGGSLEPPTVISYSKLIRGGVELPEYPDLVILDEAHYCKSPGAKRTKAAMKMAQRAPRAWLLSGTPLPNDPRELYAPVKYLWPELLKKYGIHNAFQWMDRWCVWSQNEYGFRVHGLTPAAKELLVPELRAFMLRRRTEEVALDLPPLRFDLQYLPKDEGFSRWLVARGLTSDNPEHLSTLRRLLGQYKAPKVAREIVRELRDGQYESIVVMYHHHDTGRVLKENFHGAKVSTIGFDGSASAKDRQRAIDNFQKGSAQVFLAQQGAAGVGITLTRASQIVLVEPSWSPEDNQQAVKRIHRIGQDAPRCRARIFAVPDSLDDALMGTLKRKSRMIAEVVDV